MADLLLFVIPSGSEESFSSDEVVRRQTELRPLGRFARQNK